MKISIRRPDDFHVHVRRGEMLLSVLPESARHFSRALIMPNTDPPILRAHDVVRYRRDIQAVGTGIEPLMTIKLVPGTTAKDVIEARQVGAIAGKLYPDGVTTGSEGGVRDFRAMYPVFEAMERVGMVLCLHGEHPDAFCLDREVAFLAELDAIAGTFPRLKIVLEHVSTAAAVRAVERLPGNVAATVTVHHLYLTLDDVIGGLLRPHFFCKPVAKRPEDREALIRAATGGNPKFFLGTDSAPHSRGKKECDGGCSGVFTAPVAMSALAAKFEERDALEKLEDFTSRFGAEFYGLPLNEGKLLLEKTPWRVPYDYRCRVVPMYSGQTLEWRVFG
jgi:dihydroorotase